MPARDPLPADQIEEALADLDGWRYAAASDDRPERIVWGHQFPDFTAAWAFLTRVAFLAEAMDHHPEITNVYGDVRLALSTHDAGDRVTDTDLAFARRVTEIAPAA